MSELTLTLLRLGYLALLWMLVLSVALVIRRDVYGTRVTPRRSSTRGRAQRRAQAPQQPQPQAAVPTAPPLPVPAASPAGPPPSAAPAPVPSASQAPAPSGPTVTHAATHLVVTEGSLQGTALALGQAPVLIGRAPECTLVLEDDYASGRHARLYQADGSWWVEDLGSTNGTFVGRQKIERPTPVAPGVDVKVGRTVIELRR
jgi:hypothetical protein